MGNLCKTRIHTIEYDSKVKSASFKDDTVKRDSISNKREEEANSTNLVRENFEIQPNASLDKMIQYDITEVKDNHIEIIKGNFENLTKKTPTEIRIFLSSTFKGFLYELNIFFNYSLNLINH